MTVPKPTPEELLFPILQPSYSGVKAYVPWAMVAPHEAQAQKNHDQTLKRLAERGGLGWCELCAVLENRPWHKMANDVAQRTVLNAVMSHYRALKEQLQQPEVTRTPGTLEVCSLCGVAEHGKMTDHTDLGELGAWKNCGSTKCPVRALKAPPSSGK